MKQWQYGHHYMVVILLCCEHDYIMQKKLKNLNISIESETKPLVRCCMIIYNTDYSGNWKYPYNDFLPSLTDTSALYVSTIVFHSNRKLFSPYR